MLLVCDAYQKGDMFLEILFKTGFQAIRAVVYVSRDSPCPHVDPMNGEEEVGHV